MGKLKKQKKLALQNPLVVTGKKTDDLHLSQEDIWHSPEDLAVRFVEPTRIYIAKDYRNFLVLEDHHNRKRMIRFFHQLRGFHQNIPWQKDDQYPDPVQLRSLL